MPVEELRKRIVGQELTLGEVFSGAFRMLAENFKEFFLLSILVYAPANLIVEILMLQLPEEITTEAYLRVAIIQCVVSIYTMIATSVATIMARDRLEDREKRGFWAIFSEGVGTWPLFLLTTIVFGGAFLLIMTLAMSLLLSVPFLLVPAITATLILSVFVVLYVYGFCIMAALHKSILRNNLEQVRSAIKDHRGKSIGMLLLASVIGLLITMPVVSFTSVLGTLLGSNIAAVIINTIIESIISIVNIFASLVIIIRFINLENLKQ